MKSDANQGKESSHFNVVMAQKLHFCVNEAPQLTSKMVICQKDALRLLTCIFAIASWHHKMAPKHKKRRIRKIGYPTFF